MRRSSVRFSAVAAEATALAFDALAVVPRQRTPVDAPGDSISFVGRTHALAESAGK